MLVLWLPQAPPSLIPMAQVVNLLLDCARGMAFLHSCSIAHRDLKSANLLLAADGTAKVAEFGLSREVFDPAAMSRVGSVQWAAPEVLLGLEYDTSCDHSGVSVFCAGSYTHGENTIRRH